MFALNMYNDSQMKSNFKPFFLIVFLFFSTIITAQDSTWTKAPTINVSGFLDVYYVYDFNQPTGNVRQNFFYNHNRHNEFNLNLGIVKLGLAHEKYRANLAFQTGTYVNDNYQAEPTTLKYISEGSVGFSLNKRNNWWIDAGIFASHIGFESAISSDNFTMTRSILAENSPYFFGGIKSTYTSKNEKLEFTALILNGWQRIQRVANSSIPSFGTQLKWSPSDKFTFNWSTFVGTNDPDNIRRMRYFNNFYAQFSPAKKWDFIAGFDLGMQQQSKASSNYNNWLSPVLISRYHLSEKWKIAARVEKYTDKNGVLIQSNSIAGFDVNGFSINTDFTPNSLLMWRLEARLLQSKHKEFEKKNDFSNYNFFIGSSIAIKIPESKISRN
jgi:hypothetical protein